MGALEDPVNFCFWLSATKDIITHMYLMINSLIRDGKFYITDYFQQHIAYKVQDVMRVYGFKNTHGYNF